MARRRITQAVVLIHDAGEQRPMDTLRRFVEAVLPPRAEGEPYFSKPDALAETLELRKLQDRTQPRTHFFEYYWAYKVQGTSFWHVTSWLQSLLLRRVSQVPRQLKPIWAASWLLLIAAAAGWFLYMSGRGDDSEAESLPFWFATASTALLGSLQTLVLTYVGGVARYLSPHPGNVALRQAIRADGVQLLRKLHDETDSKGATLYERVVIVGHGLGSVIAYDVLKHFWEEIHRVYEKPSAHDQEALAEVERAGAALGEQPSELQVRDYQRAQTQLWWELQELGNPWRITDLVTLGSPLAHAAMLLASGAGDLAKRQRQRELPACPPIAEIDRNGQARYSFRVWDKYSGADGDEHVLRALHHAALFAVTRWTNLYYPTRLAIFGDVAGGPLAGVLGPGILDRSVSTGSWRGRTPLAHHAYWLDSEGAAKHPAVDELIAALDRGGERTYRHLMEAEEGAEGLRRRDRRRPADASAPGPRVRQARAAGASSDRPSGVRR